MSGCMTFNYWLLGGTDTAALLDHQKSRVLEKMLQTLWSQFPM